MAAYWSRDVAAAWLSLAVMRFLSSGDNALHYIYGGSHGCYKRLRPHLGCHLILHSSSVALLL